MHESFNYRARRRIETALSMAYKDRATVGRFGLTLSHVQIYVLLDAISPNRAVASRIKSPQPLPELSPKWTPVTAHLAHGFHSCMTMVVPRKCQ